MADKVIYLMRGLPSCGKSHTAKRLAGENGLICETDEYFLSQVGHDPQAYDYDSTLLDTARAWNFARFQQGVDDGVTPIVVDRGNSLSLESQRYARYAVERGYRVELTEPDSPWWQEIRVLLKYKRFTKPVLLEWSEHLAAMSRSTHRVPAASIRRRMARWKHDVTVDAILSFVPDGDGSGRRSRRRGGVVAFDPAWGSAFEALTDRAGAVDRESSDAGG